MTAAHSARPSWVEDLAAAAGEGVAPDWPPELMPPAEHDRASAVLMLFSGSSPEGLPDDVLLTERAHTLRSHPGQISFPGGRVDPQDGGNPVQAALREAREETGLDREGVEIVGCLPTIYIPVSDYTVRPVLGWWRRPSSVCVIDTAEVAQVRRVSVACLVDPANRFQAQHPRGYRGPAFDADDWLIWGFTGYLLDRLLHLTGWEQPWDVSRVKDLPE